MTTNIYQAAAAPNEKVAGTAFAGICFLLFTLLFSLFCFGVPLPQWLVGLPLAGFAVTAIVGGIYQAGRTA